MHKHPLIAHPLRAIVLISILVTFIFILQSFTKQTDTQNTVSETQTQDLCEDMTREAAMEIAQNTENCLAAGAFQFKNNEMNFCNRYTKTWQFILTDVTEPLCGAACSIHTNTGEAEVNWMCTGALVEEIDN
jgi:hypothetical protein